MTIQKIPMPSPDLTEADCQVVTDGIDSTKPYREGCGLAVSFLDVMTGEQVEHVCHSSLRC